MELDYKVIIIGSGPTGMTAALYLKRANMDICIIERDAPGGQLLKTAMIKNYPGVKEIEGPELALKMYEQVTELEVPYIFSEVIDIEIKDDYFIVETKEKKLTCKSIVIATGRSPRRLGIENEDKLINKGISFCATCDGSIYKGKEVAVVGAGNAAVEEAIFLAGICSKVTLINRKDTFRADAKIVEELKSLKNVNILYNSEIKRFNEKEGVLGSIDVINNKTNDETTIEVEGCFEFVGQTSNALYLMDLGILDDKSNILINESCETKIEGIYAGGDCTKKDLYQIVTAAADGAIAAIHIIKNRK